jgi:hypothetical protein
MSAKLGRNNSRIAAEALKFEEDLILPLLKNPQDWTQRSGVTSSKAHTGHRLRKNEALGNNSPQYQSHEN